MPGGASPNDPGIALDEAGHAPVGSAARLASRPAGTAAAVEHNAIPSFEIVVMQIWVDADACPGAVKEILYRAAARHGLPLTLVANQWLRVPPSPYIRSIQVARGFDVADSHIVDQVVPGDLVITADIPLAALVIDKQAIALNPRGELYGAENIRQLLDMRNFMDSLRSTGVATGGPPAFSHADRQCFANQLDRLIAKRNSAGRTR